MIKKIISSALLIMCNVYNVMPQVGIGTTSPDTSAVLDVYSEDKGFLVPRLTTAERDQINLPAEGLIVYNTVVKCLQINIGAPNSPDWTCVGLPPEAFMVTNCDESGFITSLNVGEPTTVDNVFKATISNNGSQNLNLSFSPSDVVLSTGFGLSISSVNPVSATIVPGAIQTIEYALSGTPSSTGGLIGTWSVSNLTCTDTIEIIGNGQASFNLPQTITVASILDGTPLTDFQGVIDNGSNQIQVKIPYTSGTGGYSAFTGVYSTNAIGTGEGGDVNQFRLTYPSGVFSGGSGHILATIEVSGIDESFNAKKQLFNITETITTFNFKVNGQSQGMVNLVVSGGIPDRNYSDPLHQFVYFPVTAADGNVWLNNNLGADYSNVNYINFNPTKQATSTQDYHAYGSLYQWGRGSDGHELTHFTSSNSNSGVNSTSTTVSVDVPGHDNFIMHSLPPHDWRIPQNDNLWQGVNGVNNPCPLGYRVPTETEWQILSSAGGIFNSTVALNSRLALSSPGFRVGSVPVLEPIVEAGLQGFYYTSTPAGFNSVYISFLSTSSVLGGSNRANGMSVRCIKD